MKGDYDRGDGIVGYAWMARYTLQFLSAYLRHDADALAFLTRAPVQNGVPKHVMAVNHRQARPIGTSFDAFREAVGHLGFDEIAEVYAAFQRERPTFRLDRHAVNAWAEELLDVERLVEAIGLLKINVRMYPDSSDAYTSLGRAYEKSGQIEVAIQSYQRAVELDSTNSDARMKVSDLIRRDAASFGAAPKSGMTAVGSAERDFP
jgi:tetratricopeptide (TPR) repeat protein